MNKKLTVLFISTAIPPFQESQTIRNVFLISGLIQSGHEVVILTKEMAGDGDNTLMKYIDNLHVYKTDVSNYDNSVKLIRKLPFGKYLAWLYGIYVNLFYVPDPNKNWEEQVVSCYERVKERYNVDVIVSASGSYTAHIAAEIINSKYRVPYIMELGDPWTYNPIWPANLKHRIKSNKLLEEKTLSSASAITVTTEETSSIYRDWGVSKRLASYVIPMGFTRGDFRNSLEKKENSKLVITYVGVAYKRGRNLIPVINALGASAKKHVTLQIVGQYSRSFERHVDRLQYNFVSFVGVVNYIESIQYINKADILLIIGNRGGVQIPGKIYMYIATDNPILYVKQEEKDCDPAWDLIKELPGVAVVNAHEDDIRIKLTEMIESIGEWRKHSRSRKNMAFLKKYEWDNIGKMFSSVVERHAG